MGLVVHREREEGHDPRALDLVAQLLLVAGAGARDPPGQDLPPLGYEVLEDMGRLVVQGQRLVFAEPARLAPVVRLLPGVGV